MDREDSRVRYLHVTSNDEALDALKGIEADPCSIRDILPKMLQTNIILEHVESEAANVIKQEMRNVGGDAAICQDAIGCRIADGDVILMGTIGQIRSFSEKMSNATPRSAEDIGTYNGSIG